MQTGIGIRYGKRQIRERDTPTIGLPLHQARFRMNDGRIGGPMRLGAALAKT